MDILGESIAVRQNVGKEYSNKYGFTSYVECSCFENFNIEEVFSVAFKAAEDAQSFKELKQI